MADPIRTEGEPHDRLTTLAAAMLAALEDHPDYAGDRAVVMIDADGRGGIGAHGWDDDLDAAVAILMHVRAILQANGRDLAIIDLPARGRG